MPNKIVFKAIEPKPIELKKTKQNGLIHQLKAFLGQLVGSAGQG
jgi:hypothetical protein